MITEHDHLFESWSPIEGFEYSPEIEEFCQMISDFIDANGVPDRDECVETHTDHDDTQTMRAVFKYNGERMSFGGGVRNNTLIFVRYR